MIVYNNQSGLTNVYLGNTNIAKVYIGNYQAYPSSTPPTPSTNVITYTASSKLNVVTTAFTPTVTAETFDGGNGIIEFAAPVTAIGNWSFYNKSQLTNINIPNSVASIGQYAFTNCSGLTSVTIGSGVTSIANNAFSNCSGLTSVTIPSGVTSINDSVFSNCRGLTSVTIPDSVTSIGSQAFGRCGSLTSVTIPDSVTSIGEAAFGYCSGLTSIDMPDSVTSIGSNTFYNCRSLTSVTVNVVTPPTLGEGAFDGSTCPIYVPCESVNAYKSASGWSTYEDRIQCVEPSKAIIKLNDGTVVNIPYNGSSALTDAEVSGYSSTAVEVEIDSGVTTFNYTNPFSGFTKLRLAIVNPSTPIAQQPGFGVCVAIIVPPESVETYKAATIWKQFNNLGYVVKLKRYSQEGVYNICVNPTVINREDITLGIPPYCFTPTANSFFNFEIGNSVTSIGQMAFSGCTSLTSITIPDSVTSIGQGAFYNLSNLITVTMGSGVTSIGNQTFSNCSDLNSITINATTPPTLGSAAFNNTPNTMKIYVPSGSVNAYKTASGWSTYADRIQAIP